MLFSLGQRTVFATFFLLFSISTPTFADTIEPPRLYEDSDYHEYWEQQFLFEDGTFVTSQFLIVNFPFSKHHGLMVGTLKKPDTDTIIIKNGRKRSGWNFDGTQHRLSIFQHQLSGASPNYKVHLNNTAAEVDIEYTSMTKAIPVTLKGNDLGLPEIHLYASTAKASGRWRAGPEIGGKGDAGPWELFGSGSGYGLHVVHKKSMNHALRQWQRFTPLTSIGNYAPVLHAFETPKGKEKVVLVLATQAGEALRFKTVDLTQKKANQTWALNAKSKNAQLTGTIKTVKNIENFILKDNLNTLEQMVSGSLADISRYRYTATYSLTLKMNGQETPLSGTFLMENIQLGKEKKKKRRDRR